MSIYYPESIKLYDVRHDAHLNQRRGTKELREDEELMLKSSLLTGHSDRNQSEKLTFCCLLKFFQTLMQNRPNGKLN